MSDTELGDGGCLALREKSTLYRTELSTGHVDFVRVGGILAQEAAAKD